MSRTDKDRPAWVVNHEHGIIDHDHRTGVCRVETLADAARPRERYHYAGNGCRKYETISWTCTKANPDTAWARSRRHACWDRWTEWIRNEHGAIVDWVFHANQCHGHTRRVYHADWPCSCDDREPITCTPAWDFGTHYRAVSPPKWFRDAEFTNPERRRTRDELRDALRRANAGDDLADFDFANRQGRNGARWAWS